MARCYKIYGLKIKSDIEIPEALEIDLDSSETPDVTIRHGKMPDDYYEMVEKGDFINSGMVSKKDSMILKIVGTGVYHISKDEVVIEEDANATHHYVKAYLLGSCLGYCMYLRNIIAIHGGGIEKYGKGIIVTGESGAGKSTVCNNLRTKGFDFISDDVCAISFKDINTPHIELAYPQQKLCKDAALALGYDLSELIYIDEYRDKYAIRLKDRFLKDGAPFKYLFEIALAEDDAKEIKVEKIDASQKLFAIIRNIYRGEGSINMWGMPPTSMQACAKMAATIEVYKITRPKGTDTVKDIMAFIEKTVK